MNRKVKGSPAFKTEVAFIFPVIQSPVISGDLKEKGAKRDHLCGSPTGGGYCFTISSSYYHQTPGKNQQDLKCKQYSIYSYK